MRERWMVKLACAAPVAAGAPAFAAETGGGPFAGNVGNALWTLVVFGLVVFVLGKFAWGPILKGLQEREQFIRESLEAARRERTEAELRLKAYTDQMNAARNEATAIVEEARRDAEEVKRRIEEEASGEARQIVERSRREIELAKETALKELYTASAKLTTELAGKILEREISPADHERLIRESIARLSGGAS